MLSWQYQLYHTFTSQENHSNNKTHSKVTNSHSNTGTKEGYVVVFDSSGEEIERYSANGSKISAISVVTDHIAGCSDDGTVSIKNLTHDKNDLSIFEFSDPIHSLCLDPRYDTSKHFVGVGESKCIINEKGGLVTRPRLSIKVRVWSRPSHGGRIFWRGVRYYLSILFHWLSITWLKKIRVPRSRWKSTTRKRKYESRIWIDRNRWRVTLMGIFETSLVGWSDTIKLIHFSASFTVWALFCVRRL